MKAHPILHVGRFASVRVSWRIGRLVASHVVDGYQGRRVDWWHRSTNGKLNKWAMPVFR